MGYARLRIPLLLLLLCGCSKRPAATPGSESVPLIDAWTVGRTDGEGPDVFGDVGGLLVDPLGRVHVLDVSAGEVRVFDSEGRYVRTYAGPGSGPGELAGPAGLALHPAGEIWILDVSNNRYSLYDTAGVHLTDLRRLANGYSRPWMGGFDREGHLLDVTFRPVPTGTELVLVRADVARGADLAAVAIHPTDTFPLPRPDPERFLVTEIDPSGRKRQVSVAIPFASGLSRELSPAGTVWEARTDRYRLVEFEPGGDTLRRVERAVEAVPVLPHELDSALAALGERTSPGLAYDRTRIPRAWPVVESFFGDSDGRLWVRPITRPPVRAFDVLLPSGGWMRLESSDRLESTPRPVVRGDTVWAIVRDELGVARVRKAMWMRR